MPDWRDKVRERLISHDIKPTLQRIELAEILFAKPKHWSAEQVLAEARGSGSQISKATVYNTLNLFVDSGLLREVRVDPSRCFYDPTTTPHHHFYNADTGEIRDIQPEEITFERLPAAPRGTETDGVDVVIRLRTRR